MQYATTPHADPRARRANWFNYINLSHPDTSGMLRFLTDELQDAEDAGDRGACLPRARCVASVLSRVLCVRVCVLQRGSWGTS